MLEMTRDMVTSWAAWVMSRGSLGGLGLSALEGAGRALQGQDGLALHTDLSQDGAQCQRPQHSAS